MLDWGRSQDVMAATPNCKYGGSCIPKVKDDVDFSPKALRFYGFGPLKNVWLHLYGFVKILHGASRRKIYSPTANRLPCNNAHQFPHLAIVSLHPCPSTSTATSIATSIIHYSHTQTSKCLHWHCIIIQRACSRGTLRLTSSLSTVLAFYTSHSSNLKGKTRLKL